MKSALIDTLAAAAERDPSVVLLTGDLGYGAFEAFQERFPNRFINCGVAEQNMLGVAGGMAAEGLRPVVYSIGNFLVLRAAEQIRNDVVAPRRPVLLVAAGGGFTYGAAGYSHHLTEDLAFMRSLPGLTVFTPSQVSDIGPMVSDWLNDPRPVYLRLDRPYSRPDASDQPLRLGHWRTVRTGRDVTVFGVGSTVGVGLDAADLLQEQGVSARVVDCTQMTGLESASIDDLLTTSALAVTVEEHSVHGGLSSIVAEEITSRGLPIPLLRFGVHGAYAALVGRPAFLQQEYGMSAAAIAEAVIRRVSDRD